MMDVCGKPLLERVIDRVKTVVDVIVATPDTEIAGFCTRIGVDSFIGSEEDVLDRYYQCAKQVGCSHIVRLTADNPLIDPEIISKVVDYYMENDFDYVTNSRTKATYPIGQDVEIFSRDALAMAYLWADSDYDKEHVTPYMYKHPELFYIGTVENDEDLSDRRMTVDYPEDLEYVRDVYSKLNGNFSMEDILEVI